MQDSPIARELKSDLAGLGAVFSSKGADRLVQVGNEAGEQGRRSAGLPTEMDGHRARLDDRLANVERLPRTNLDRNEIAFLKAYQHATATSLIRQAAHLDNEGHGPGVVATMVDRAVEAIEDASPTLGKLADKGLDAIDWKQFETVFDPEHAEHATNGQGLAASIVVAAEIAPMLKPELIVEKGAASAEKQLAKAIERQAENHPKQFLESAEKALKWADKHLPKNAKKLFDKVLDKMVDYAKELIPFQLMDSTWSHRWREKRSSVYSREFAVMGEYGSGGPLGLQNRRGLRKGAGRFDSYTLPPIAFGPWIYKTSTPREDHIAYSCHSLQQRRTHRGACSGSCSTPTCDSMVFTSIWSLREIIAPFHDAPAFRRPSLQSSEVGARRRSIAVYEQVCESLYA